jgi:hypothetical protein
MIFSLLIPFSKNSSSNFIKALKGVAIALPWPERGIRHKFEYFKPCTSLKQRLKNKMLNPINYTLEYDM